VRPRGNTFPRRDEPDAPVHHFEQASERGRFTPAWIVFHAVVVDDQVRQTRQQRDEVRPAGGVALADSGWATRSSSTVSIRLLAPLVAVTALHYPFEAPGHRTLELRSAVARQPRSPVLSTHALHRASDRARHTESKSHLERHRCIMERPRMWCMLLRRLRILGQRANIHGVLIPRLFARPAALNDLCDGVFA
jgi:hypothetical protein